MMDTELKECISLWTIYFLFSTQLLIHIHCVTSLIFRRVVGTKALRLGKSFPRKDYGNTSDWNRSAEDDGLLKWELCYQLVHGHVSCKFIYAVLIM